MPSITLCRNRECSMRMSCYRYRGVKAPWAQSYFAADPRKDGSCDYFVEIRDRHVVSEDEADER